MTRLMKEVSLLLGLIASTSAENSAICNDPSKYTGAAVLEDEMTCDDGVTTFGLATVSASETECWKMITNQMSDQEPKGMISRMFPYSMLGGPCCGGSGTVCDEWKFNPCADASKFNGTARATMGGPGSPSSECAEVQGAYNSFTASADTCAATVVSGMGNMTRNALLNLMAPCCTSGGTACDAYMFNPCKVASQFMPDLKPAQMGGGTCKTGVSRVPAFTPSLSTCSAVLAGSDGSMSRIAYVSLIANDYGCCGDKASACDAYSLMPCKDSSKFVAAGTVSNGTVSNDTTCGRFFKKSATFFADTESCKAMGPGGQATWSDGFEGIASFCCDDTPTVCDNPPAPTTTTLGVDVPPAPTTTMLGVDETSFACRSQTAQLVFVGTLTSLALSLALA